MQTNLVPTLLQRAKQLGIRLPKRLAKQLPAIALEREYGQLIKSTVLETVLKLLRLKLIPRLEELSASTSRIAQDADTDLGDIIDEVFEEYSRQWTRRRIGDAVRREATKVSGFQANQLNRQLRPVLGLDVAGNEAWLPAAIEDFTRENISLVSDVPDQLLSNLEKMISRDLADGVRFEELAVNIEKQFDIAKSRAEMIAMDQVQKFQGDLNRVRQQDLGISKYVWNSLGDETVRPEHAERDGKTFSWSSPPWDGHPGEPINCRCWAEPVLE
jgi:SPP1 gp7 family putative phage head morphogenesis protein